MSSNDPVSSRRMFLALLAALPVGYVGCGKSGSGGALAPDSGTDDTDSRNAEVIVIGAGIAGLRAAEVLAGAGKAVIVLEARDRIGGRIWTDRSWGKPLDLGASWIHGITNNPIAQRAAMAGIRTVPSDYSEALYDAMGTRRPDGDVGRIEKRVRAIATTGRANSPDADESLRAALDRAIAAAAPSDAERLEIEFGITSVFEHEYAADASELSANNFDDGANEAGGDALFPDGYDAIPLAMAKGLDVRTGHVVARIDAGATGISIETNRGVFSARAVVVTVPLGVLKRGSIAFGTPLSAGKTAAIARLGMGALSKTYLRFDRAFWPAGVDLIDRIPAGGERAQWIETLDAAKLVALPALCMFNAGAYARRVEAMSEADVIAAASASLAGMFGAAFVASTGSLRSRWSVDPYSLGAYSFLAVGSSLADRDALGAPERAIFFAGEACSRDHAATVHGAYASGESAARAILEG